MHQEWKKEDVHRRLSLEARSREFKESYLLLLDLQPALRSYRSPESLIGMLHEKGGGYAEKDRALHAVITAAQNEPDLRKACLTLISLALWPAIEHSYYKLLPLSSRVPDLIAEIHWSLMGEVLRFNLAKMSRIAINLQLNVEKAVRRAVEREAEYDERNRVYAFLAADLDQSMDEPHRNRIATLREWSDDLPVQSILRCVRTPRRAKNTQALSDPDRQVLVEALRGMTDGGLLSEEESRIIEDHVLNGTELEDIARQMGLRSEALRGRYFRLKARLQARLEQRNAATKTGHLLREA